ncbi:MAG: RnfABCDGE type electron transport complex subunit B [Gammaproteobacteria bacterium]
MIAKTLAEQIDALLPQTQCGLCGHGGCMPYAKAIAERNEAINRCPPGGIRVLTKLADLLEQDVQPFLTDMQASEKPSQVAVIREEACIGCLICIKACPVDAIVGAPKLMHTVISDACTGCELCVAPCPMDCIDMVETSAPVNEHAFYQQAESARQRYYKHNQRLAANEKSAKTQHEKAVNVAVASNKQEEILAARQAFIAEAVARAKAKKGT